MGSSLFWVLASSPSVSFSHLQCDSKSSLSATNTSPTATHALLISLDVRNADQATSCSQFVILYWHLAGDGFSLCVDDCTRFATHLPDLLSHTCYPGMCPLMVDCQIDCHGYLCSSDRKECLDEKEDALCLPWSLEMPDGSCSLFGCPAGYYRNQADRSCQPCHSSCESCHGPSD